MLTVVAACGSTAPRVTSDGGYSGGDDSATGTPMPAHWDMLPAVAHPRFYTGAAAAGGKLYLIGGTTGGVSFNTAPERFAADVFDPVTSAWAELPPLPVAFIMPNVASVADQLFVLGGLDTNQTFVYDAANRAWVAKKPIPVTPGRGGAAVGVSGTTVYLAGGAVRGQSANMLNTGMRQSTLFAYDTVVDDWQTLAELPMAVGYATGAVVNNQLWVMGGSTDFSRTDQVWTFDIAGGQWTTKTDPLPVGLSSATADVLGGRIYLIGGIATSIGRINGDTLVLDLATETWTTMTPLPTPRFAMGSGVIDGRIYVPTGEAELSMDMFGATPAFEVFTPERPAQD
ncbi:MAG: hypothetical protein QOI66_5359 [Myxococcales bacterium]|nr:hypothetical protein [Myxococcales bacterium]